MYGEWYGVCDFVVLSVVKVCIDYGGVNVFHVCHDFCVVYGVVFHQYYMHHRHMCQA